jgi:hypothetical protein
MSGNVWAEATAPKPITSNAIAIPTVIVQNPRVQAILRLMLHLSDNSIRVGVFVYRRLGAGILVRVVPTRSKRHSIRRPAAEQKNIACSIQAQA